MSREVISQCPQEGQQAGRNVVLTAEVGGKWESGIYLPKSGHLEPSWYRRRVAKTLSQVEIVQDQRI